MKSFKQTTVVLLSLYVLVQMSAAEIADVTYEELKELNVTCPPYDTCSTLESRATERLTDNECNCDVFCVRYDTCCVDSLYKYMPKPSIKPSCRLVHLSVGYFMVDRCPQNEDFLSVYDDLCRKEWNGENDIMRLVPVTSLFTHITYKNYFCFRCHETNDDFVFWNVRTEYESQSAVKEDTHILLEFDKHQNTWIAAVGQRGAFIPVSFPEFDVPLSIRSVPKKCRDNVISNCSEYWDDDVIRSKCDAYMAMTSIYREDGTREYRNPHCAICNFEDLNNFFCRNRYIVTGLSGAKKPFSFTLLLDINRSDGEKVGKVQKCDSSASWDPFFKKCRKLTCALPGYVVKDGKCTAP